MYYVERTSGGMLELRQDRFIDERQTRGGVGHPHDVCAIARDRSEMQGMLDRYLPGRVTWGDVE